MCIRERLRVVTAVFALVVHNGACTEINAVNTDACTNACTVARCGDGIVHTGVEACDDGNTVDADACTNACTVPTAPASFSYAQCALPAHTADIATTSVARPAYVQSNPRSSAITPADFNTMIVRVSGDTGTTITGFGVVWRANNGPDYTKSQPWNADESVMMIPHGVSGSGGPVFTDGTTYVPFLTRSLYNGVTYGGAVTCPCGYRWHPTKPEWMVLTGDNGNIAWWNPVTNVFKSKYVHVAGYSGTTFSGDEGTLSDDGDRVLLQASSGPGGPTFWVVGNLNGSGPDDVSGVRISPFYTPGSVGLSGFDGGQIAAFGQYAFLHNGSNYNRLVDFSAGAGGGVVYMSMVNQGHQDACTDVAGNPVLWSCGSSDMVKMSAPSWGAVTNLTPDWNHPDFWHTSCRNYRLPGWGIGSSECGAASCGGSTVVFYGEIVAVELKANGTYRRIAKHRQSISAGGGVTSYEKGPWAVPSPSGSRIMFSSDWGNSAHDADAYVVELNNSAPCSQ